MTRATLDRPGDFLGGRFVSVATSAAKGAPDGDLVVRSPADLDDLVGVHAVSLAHVDRAVDVARDAWPSWRRASGDERYRLLRAYRDRLRVHQEAIAETIAREAGKPLWEARGEASALSAKVDVMLGEGAAWTRDRRIEELPGEIRYRPHGVLAVIGPFNFPGHLPNGQIVPALALGNTVVFKPSERTPNTAVWIARCMHEAGLPPGVFNLVQGRAESAQRLVEHEGVDGVLFTGSARVGRAIARATSERPGKLVALELGGKNASIVLDDIARDARALEHVARQISFGAFVTAGQRCTATSRVYATPGVIDALTERIATAARHAVVGYPLDDDVFLGPMIADEARAAFNEATRCAREGGYEAIVGGGSCSVAGRRGYYQRPSVHRAPDGALDVEGYTQRELFGPDVAVYPVSDLDEAIARTNATRYGLSASVFTHSESVFEHAADGLRVGVLNWNRSTAGASGRLPFGGVKDSGNHRPAGVTAGLLCAYPQAVLLRAEDWDEAQKWPGLAIK